MEDHVQEIALAKNNAFAHRDTLENSVKIVCTLAITNDIFSILYDKNRK